MLVESVEAAAPAVVFGVLAAELVGLDRRVSLDTVLLAKRLLFRAVDVSDQDRGRGGVLYARCGIGRGRGGGDQKAKAQEARSQSLWLGSFRILFPIYPPSFRKVAHLLPQLVPVGFHPFAVSSPRGEELDEGVLSRVEHLLVERGVRQLDRTTSLCRRGQGDGGRGREGSSLHDELH